MSQFRKKPVVVEATQWFKNGDHPEDKSVPVRRWQQGDPVPSDVQTHTGDLVPDPLTGEPSFLSEGQVVRYYRRPDDDANRSCEHCWNPMRIHGWIDTKEGGHIVCPSDWIITGVAGERYPCKPHIFVATYDQVL